MKYRRQPGFCRKVDARFAQYSKEAPSGGDSGFLEKLHHLCETLTAIEMFHLSYEKQEGALLAGLQRAPVTPAVTAALIQWDACHLELKTDIEAKCVALRALFPAGAEAAFVSDADLYFLASALANRDCLDARGIKDLTAFLLRSENYPDALEMDPAEDCEAVPAQDYSDSLLMTAWMSDHEGRPIDGSLCKCVSSKESSPNCVVQ